MKTPADEQRIAAIHKELGIPPRFAHERALSLHLEPARLVSIGPDLFGRPQRLTPVAAARWHALRQAARAEGIELWVVSAFRSIDYQYELIRRKLEQGQDITQILAVNAPPGYSEHHSGRALDLTTPGCPPLTEEFEDTPAFAWLVRRADEFDFLLTYPRENAQGFIYEPWHWALREHGDTKG